MIRATPTSESFGKYSSRTSVLINFALMRFKTVIGERDETRLADFAELAKV